MGTKANINPASVIDDYFKYVEQYRTASSCLSSAKNTLFPSQQVRGLLIELTLKTYLCACDKIVWGHDLVSLADEAVKNDLTLNESDHKKIISDTNDIYCRGGSWDSDYICRYPKPNRGILLTVTPSHEMVDEMVLRILEQANSKRSC